MANEKQYTIVKYTTQKVRYNIADIANGAGNWHRIRQSRYDLKKSYNLNSYKIRERERERADFLILLAPS